MNIVGGGGSTEDESFLPKINSNSSKKSFYQEKPGKSSSKSTEKPRAGSIQGQLQYAKDVFNDAA